LALTRAGVRRFARVGESPSRRARRGLWCAWRREDGVPWDLEEHLCEIAAHDPSGNRRRLWLHAQIATTVATLSSVRGKPDTGEPILFVVGGIVSFAALDAGLQAVSFGDQASPEHAFPFARTLNFVAVTAAFGVATTLAHGLHSALAWLVAPAAATATYMLLVAL
jgi:hypothetical protein